MTTEIILENEKEKELLIKEEGDYVDLKSSLISPSKLSKTISAFANSSGGEIYIGIQEDTRSGCRTIDGYDKKEDCNDIFTMLETLKGLNGEFTTNFLIFTNGKVGLEINIFKNHSIVETTDGEIYVRKNAQNLKIITDEQKRKLELDKGIFQYENTRVIGTAIADAMNSRVYQDFSTQVIPNIDRFNWLNTQKLCVESNLNIVGTLLFTDEPQAFLPKRSAIKIYRYKTSGEGVRANLDGTPITVEGCAYNLIYDAVKKVKEIIETMKKLNEKFYEIEYPDTTIHEIVTNAVLHRDYSIMTDIQIRIFDNRVEVESPGKLAGHITLDNILHEQFSRNPQFVRLINKFPSPPNKDVGEGLNTAFKAMTALRLKQPIILEKDNSVLVIIKHERLSSPEELVMEYLNTHSEITNSAGREITGISSENTMKRVFYKLRDADYIEMKRQGNKSVWVLKRKVGDSISGQQYTQISLFDEGNLCDR